MKKVFRFLLVLILIVAAAVVILGIIEPKDVTVQRNTIIKAPTNVVFDQMVKFMNWPHWSPWYQMDSTAKLSYTGIDGTPGSSYHWVGDKKKTGEGDMKNVSVQGTQMNFDVNFIVPFKSHAVGYLKAEDAGNGTTKATWSFTSHFNFPMNAMLVFMNMDKMLGGDFDRGLANMKKYVESMPADGVEIKEVQYPAHTFEGIRKTMNWGDMQQFFANSYAQIGKAAGSNINGAAVGIYYTWDEKNQKTDVAAAFPVSDTSKPVNGSSCIVVAQSKAYMAVNKGGYSGLGKVHDALKQYAIAHNAKPTLVLEEYTISPSQTKDSTQWMTNVYYLIQ